jgi:hypothetical protein
MEEMLLTGGVSFFAPFLNHAEDTETQDESLKSTIWSRKSDEIVSFRNSARLLVFIIEHRQAVK